VHTGTALTSFKANACPPNGLSPLGRDYFVAAQLGRGGSLHVWAWHKDQPHQRSFASEPLTAVAATPDGVFLAAGGASGAVHLWETSSGRLLKSWPAHYKVPAPLPPLLLLPPVPSPSASIAAAAGHSGRQAARHLITKLARRSPAATPPAQAVTCLAWSDGGAVLVSGGEDTLVNAWLLAEVLDVTAGQQLQVRRGVVSMTVCVCVCGGGGGGARPPPRLAALLVSVHHAAGLPAAREGGSVPRELAAAGCVGSRRARCCQRMQQGKLLIAPAACPALSNPLQTGGPLLQPLASWSDHTLPVTCLAVGAGEAGALLASGSLDRTVTLRRLGDAGGPPLRTVALPAAVRCLALDPGEHSLYAGCASGAIYDVSLVDDAAAAGDGGGGGGGGGLGGGDAGRHPALEGHAGAVSCLALTPDAAYLLSGSEDQSVRVWDLRSRQAVRVLQSPARGPVTALLALTQPPFMQASAAWRGLRGWLLAARKLLCPAPRIRLRSWLRPRHCSPLAAAADWRQPRRLWCQPERQARPQAAAAPGPLLQVPKRPRRPETLGGRPGAAGRVGGGGRGAARGRRRRLAAAVRRRSGRGGRRASSFDGGGGPAGARHGCGRRG
jgi:WD40 repeat protein